MTENRVRAGYDAVAATYAQQFGDELDHKPLERGLLGAFCDMTPPGLIADIGCGPGHITRFFAARREDVVGLDLSPEGRLLVSFHVDSPGFAPGDVNHLSTFLGHRVDMDGYFLHPTVVTRDLLANGFRVDARLDRESIAGIEFGSRRSYILARRAVRSSHGP